MEERNRNESKEDGETMVLMGFGLRNRRIKLEERERGIWGFDSLSILQCVCRRVYVERESREIGGWNEEEEGTMISPTRLGERELGLRFFLFAVYVYVSV